MQQLTNATFRQRSPDGCARVVLAAVPAIMRFVRREMRQHRQTELTVPHFRSLVYLTHNEDASLSAMAEHLGLSLPAASRMVQLLVRRGLMERRPHPDDRRRVSLSLTRRGRDAYRVARAATEAAVARALRTLTPRQLAQVGTAMGLLTEVFSPENGEQASEK